MAKRQLKLTREQLIRRRVLILAIVAAVLLSLFAACRFFVRKPELPAASTPVPDETQGAATPGPQLSGDRKKDFFTFLVVGRDSGGGGNTDTMMVVAYDVPNQTVNILNVYRDTMVNVSWDIKRINSVYNVLGMDGLKEHVKKLIGFAPDYYIKIELEAFGQLVEAVGGVNFEIPNDMNYDDPTQDLHIHFQKGMQHLDGDDAMRVIRWRKNNDGSGISVGDVGRVQIQQRFITALAKQCLKIGNITKVGEFARIFHENVDSDLTLGEMIWFGQQGLKMNTDNMQFHTLPGDYNGSAWSRSYHNYQSYVLPDAKGIVELVNQYFNPYYEEVTTGMLDIMSVNKNGSLSSSSGTLADQKAASAPTTSTTAKPSATEAPSENNEPAVSVSPEASTEPEETAASTPEASAPAEETPASTPAPSAAPETGAETGGASSAAPQTSNQMLPAMPTPAGT